MRNACFSNLFATEVEKRRLPVCDRQDSHDNLFISQYEPKLAVLMDFPDQ